MWASTFGSEFKFAHRRSGPCWWLSPGGRQNHRKVLSLSLLFQIIVDACFVLRPLLIRFLEIFPRLFSRNQNAKFLAAVSSLFDRKQWFKFTSALQDAIVRAFERIKQKQSTVGGHDEPSGKRPKISQEDQNLNLRREWLHFAGELDIFKTQIGLNVVDVSSDQESSDSPMTFAFQEGQLVRAIREG